MVKKYKVLVTGIGGNVGQGIMRIIATHKADVTVVGTNVVGFSAGNHLAHAVYETPYAYEDSYIETMLRIVAAENVDLIIPSTDYEVYYLSLNKHLFSCQIAVSDVSVCQIYLDKYLTFQHHKQLGIPFAESILPSQMIPAHWAQIIAKPRKGRGSRGIEINPSNIQRFSDDEYMLQEYIEGEEITTACYVTKKGVLHGTITFTRELENGATISCEVIDTYDEQMNSLVKSMVEMNNGLQGAFNVQSRIKNGHEIVPFEVNCRVSGTNSIRSQFGFNDVDYILSEYLFQKLLNTPQITKGKAIRVLMDVIFKDCSATGTDINNNTPHYIF
jgi:carbamoyl-phosphate synthase large subunit